MAAGAAIGWNSPSPPKAENRLRNSCRPGNPPRAPRFRSWEKSAGRRSSPIWRRSLPHSKIKKFSPNMKRRTFLKLAALSTTGLALAQSTAKPSNHNTKPITMNDVIIIGGSFAGLAGALQLGRARRKVIVLDTGLPRNRFAGHSHGLLGHDHKPPLDILAEARQQLARYPTIRLVSARADSVSGTIDHFSVLTGDGESR